jgi:putative transposase
MAHTYASNFMHCVFSSKDRGSLIPVDRFAELYAYLGGIAHGEGFSIIAAGGTVNHGHLLFVLPATYALGQPFRSSREALPGGWGLPSRGRKDMEHSA